MTQRYKYALCTVDLRFDLAETLEPNVENTGLDETDSL